MLPAEARDSGAFVHACVQENVRLLLCMCICVQILAHQHMFIMCVKQWRSWDSSPKQSEWYLQPACMALWWIWVHCWMTVKVAENRVHSHALGLLGFLISAGEHCTICTAQNTEEEEGGRRRRRENILIETVALTAMLSSDLPLCFQFQIQMQNSSLGNLTFLSPFFVFLFLLSLFLASLLRSLSPFHLIPSCSQFAFSISKCFEANASREIPPPRDWTLGLLTFFSPLYISPYCVINPPPLSLSPPPPGPAYLAPFLFFYWMYCSCLKNWFLDRGEVNLLWPGIPCWASPAPSLSIWLF